MENVVSKVFVQAKPTCQGLAIVPHSTPAGDQPGSGDPTRVTGAVPLGVRRWTRQAGGPPLGEGESGQPAPALRGRLRGEREAETEDPVHAGDWSSPGAFSAPARYLPPLPPASPMSSSRVPKASCRACGRCVVSSARRLCMGREEGVIEHCVLSHREPGPVTLGLCLRRRPVVHRRAIHRVGGAGCGARSVFSGRLLCHSGCRDGAVLASPPARGTFLMAHR